MGKSDSIMSSKLSQQNVELNQYKIFTLNHCSKLCCIQTTIQTSIWKLNFEVAWSNSEIQTAQIRLPTSTRNSECGEDIKNESKFKKESKLFKSVFTRKSSQLNNIRNLNNDVEILNDVEDKNNPVIRKTNGSSLESQITN